MQNKKINPFYSLSLRLLYCSFPLKSYFIFNGQCDGQNLSAALLDHSIRQDGNFIVRHTLYV